MKRIIGIDYGDSRIGIAKSDAFGWTASAESVADGKRGLEPVVNDICEIVKKYDADTVVVGYPLNMNGTAGPRVERTEKFIAAFSEKMPEIKVVRWDERLTTVAANRTMRELGISQKHKGVSDKIAAVFILQGYLDRLAFEKENKTEEGQ